MDLSERALEDAIIELNSMLTQTRAKIAIEPTALFMRPEVLKQLAEEHNLSQRKMLDLIVTLVQQAHTKVKP